VLRIVADTNVYISAFNFAGVCNEVLALAQAGTIELIISKPILDEIEGVLTRKFGWPPEEARAVLANIRKFARVVSPAVEVDVIKEDDADNRILECALAGAAHLVVSGDRHVRKLKTYGGIAIVGPREFLILRKSRSRWI
jgi:uncharacterized protein